MRYAKRWALCGVLLTSACLYRHGFDTGSRAPWVVNYPRSWLVLLRGHAMTPLVPQATTDTPTTFTSYPQMPAGIVLDPRTGVISGTPTELLEPIAKYTITAMSVRGSIDSKIRLRILDGFEVDTDIDSPAAGLTTDGICSGGANVGCSLRAALAEADGIPGTQVVFVPAGRYLITGGELGLGDVALIGEGQEATVLDALGASRVAKVRSGSTAYIASMTMSGGFSNAYGGSLNGSQSTSLFIADCTFRDSSAAFGGGIGVEGISQIDMEGSHVLNNQAQYNGGGIDFTTGTSGSIRTTVFAGNTAADWGGGIQAAGTSAVLQNLLVVNNYAGERGGGVQIERAQASELSASTLVGNEAPIGAAVANGGSVSMLYNTIAHNTVDSDGAAILVFGGATTLKGNLLIDNTRGASVETCSITSGTLASAGHNVTDASLVDCPLADPTDRLDVVVPTVGALQDNGGNLETLELLPNSPAIDAGGDGCTASDQRGWLRPVDGDGDGVAACDAGAFELQ